MAIQVAETAQEERDWQGSRLKLPPEFDGAGTIEQGRAFARSVRQLLRMPLAIRLLETSLLDELARLADHAEARDARAEPNSAAESKSLSSKFRAVLLRPGEHDHVRWLRLAALASMDRRRRARTSAGRGLAARAFFEVLSDLRNRSNALTAELKTCHRQLLDGQSPHRIDVGVTGQPLQPRESHALRFALAALGPPPVATGEAPPPVPKRREAKRGRDEPFPPFMVPPLTGFSDLPRLPTEDLYEIPPAIRVPRPDEDQEDAPLVTGDADDSTIYEHWLAEHCAALHLSGALLPGTDRAFTPGEAVAIGARLLELWDDRDEPAPMRLGALVYLISLLTAQPRQSVLGALAILASGRVPARPDAAWLAADRFRVHVPSSEAFARPEPQAGDALRAVTYELWLPLPVFVRTAIGGSLRPLDATLRSLSPSGWEPYLHRVKQSLGDCTPRFSEARLRHVLPVAMWMHRGDIVRTQIVAGQRLDHSSAPLHYYACRQQELVDDYCQALNPWLPEGLQVGADALRSGDSTLWIGAPCAAVRGAHLRAVTTGLYDRYRQLAQGRSHDLDRQVAAYNLLVAATAGVFAAATAHRLTYHLGLVSLSDFVFDIPGTGPGAGSGTGCDGNGPVSLAIIGDKLTDNGLVYRVVAIPAVVCDQIQTLLAAAARLAGRMRIEPGAREVREGLKALLQGEGALFQTVAAEHRTGGRRLFRMHRFRRRDLQAALDGLRIPVEHLRHRFTTIARRQGISPTDIRRQMGHSLEFVPFGPTDPDSPVTFARRIGGPLNEALVADGWKVVGPELPPAGTWQANPLPVMDVCHLGARLLAHASGRDRRLRHRVETIGIARQAELDERVATLVRESQMPVPDGEGAPPRSGPVVPDFATIEDQLPRHFRGVDELAAASRSLRRLAQASAAQAPAGRVYLPRQVFRRQVAQPVVTPAIARAYRTAGELLRWAESGQLVSRISLPVGEGGMPEDALLMLAVLELSIRAGVVRPGRLLAVLHALPTAQPDPGHDDAVVVVSPAEDPVPAAIDPEPNPRPGHAAVPRQEEALRLTGVPALMALAWRHRQLATGNLTLEDLERAVRTHVPIGLLGETINDNGLLESILQCVSMARQLTRPGLMAAWESGRLASRSFRPDREHQLRTNDWQPPFENEPTMAGVPSDPRYSSGPRAKTADAAFARSLRRRLDDQRTPNGSRPRRRVSRERLVAELEHQLQSTPGLSGTSVALFGLVRDLLQSGAAGPRLRPNTVYTYFTVLVEPLLRHLNGQDLLTMDGEDLAELAVRTLESKQEGDRGRTVQVMQRLLQVIHACGGAAVPGELLKDVVMDGVSGGPAYVVIRSELEQAVRQLRHWAVIAEAQGVGRAAWHPAECRAAALLLVCCHGLGLRVGEALSRRVDDLVESPLGLVLLVRPRRGLSLKTLSSTRAVSVASHLPASEVEQLRQWRRIREEAAGPGGALFGTFQDDSSGERISALARMALVAVAEPASARLHAGRHAIACAGFDRIMEAQKPGRYAGLPEAGWLDALAHHDAAIRLMALARHLGHATPITTLSHYTHLMGHRPDTGIGWPQPTVRALAVLALASSENALRVRLARAGKSRSGSPATWLARALGYVEEEGRAVPPVGTPAVFVMRDALPGQEATRADGFLLSHQVLGEVIRTMAEGHSASYIANRHGVPQALFTTLEDRVLADQVRLRCRYVLPLPEGAGTEKAGRLPKRHVVGSMLAACDVLEGEEPARWADFRYVVQLQSQMDGRLFMRPDHRVDSVEYCLNRVCAGQGQVMRLDESGPRIGWEAHRLTRPKGAVQGSRRLVASLRFVLFVVFVRAGLEALSRPDPRLS